MENTASGSVTADEDGILLQFYDGSGRTSLASYSPNIRNPHERVRREMEEVLRLQPFQRDFIRAMDGWDIRKQLLGRRAP